MRTRYLIPAMLISLLTLSGTNAVEKVNGQYVWRFLSGEPWPNGYDQNIGKPLNLTYARDEYSSEFFDRINNALPEKELNEAFITDDAGSTIYLEEDAEVFVTFIHEGAGYKNSFGFFTFDLNNPPQSIEDITETIVFPNLSYPHMTNGHRLSIGHFEAGTSIGFFIAANGFWWDTGVKPYRTNYFYSLQHLNPESDPELKQHTVTLYDEEVSEVIIGFEDLPRTWGDNDFNDAIFSVKSTPSTAIDASELNIIPSINDSDADGVADAQDEFPDDYTRTYSTYYPSQDSFVTLAFEDNWPKVGDYDMNDLVIKENLRTTYNAEGLVSGFIMNGYIAARGASTRNGFGLRILNQPPSLIGEASIVIDGTSYGKYAEDYQTDAVITLWSNTHKFTETGGEGKCSHFNTVKSCGVFNPVPFTLDVKFDGGITSLNHSDLDFFIFRTNKRGHEIHFAGYPPTDLFDTTIFGRHADTSDPDTGRYFKNAENLPWGLKITDEWTYPREYIDVLWAYPAYEQWVESSAQLQTTWYKESNARSTHIFKTE